MSSTHGLIVPDLGNEHYGIPVTFIGEDGDIIALGHHEPRRVLAAMRKHGRVDCGLMDDDTFGDLWDADVPGMLANLVQSYATFKGNSDGEWYGRWGETAATPGALPVTVWQP